MKSTKVRLLVSTITILVSFLILKTPISLAQEKIVNYSVTYDINKDGTVNVQEDIKYDFSSYQRHGIYRDIPYGKTNEKGEKFNLGINNFSVKDEKGKSYKYSKSTNLTNQIISLKIGDADKYVTGLKNYIINYKVSGALTYFSDHDELYWNVTGHDWTVPILNSEVHINLPEGTKDVKVVCYTGSRGSTENNCSARVQDNKVYISSLQILYPGEGWTFAVSFPKDIVAVLEPTRNHNDLIMTILGFVILAILTLLALWWYLLYPLKLLWMYLAEKANISKAKITSAWFSPPNKSHNDPYSPAETSVLANRDFDNKLISSMLIDWAQKGYIKITEDKKNEFKLLKLKDFDFAKSADKKLDSAFFGGKDIADLKALSKTISFSTNIEEVKKAIGKSLYEDKVFAKNPYDFNKKYGGIAVFGLVMIFNFGVAILASLYKKMAPLTESGVEKYGEAKSLLNFLTSQNEQLNFQSKNQMFFEKLLPYATAFGVERIWMDRFKDINIVQPDWYVGDNYSNFVRGNFATRVGSSLATSYAMSNTSSSRGFSSGSSGGSSGGGGGGGGGGSW